MDDRNSSLLGSLMKVGALGVGAAALIGGAAYLANSEMERQNRADNSRARIASTINAMTRETLECMLCDWPMESRIVTMPRCRHTFHRVCLERTHGDADESVCPKCRPNAPSVAGPNRGSTPSSSSRRPSDLSGQTETTCPANDSTASPSSTKPSELSGQTETTYKCLVCLKESENPLLELDCKHTFHGGCLFECKINEDKVANEAVCPVCHRPAN